jgi:hypothetical protein
MISECPLDLPSMETFYPNYDPFENIFVSRPQKPVNNNNKKKRLLLQIFILKFNTTFCISLKVKQ